MNSFVSHTSKSLSRRVHFLSFVMMFIVVTACPLYGQNDWPQFRGPNRDGKSLETGLLKKWPEAGPNLLRTISGIGAGFSSPVISGDRLYVTGKFGDDLKMFSFDLSETKLWEKTHGPAFLERHAPHTPYPGARAAPTVNEGMIYLLGCLGRLTAYRTSDGEQVWSVDVVKELGGRVPPWGYTESVLIDGDKLICTPGGEKSGTFAALDMKTGQVLWQSKDVTARAEYGSPILFELNNVRQWLRHAQRVFAVTGRADERDVSASVRLRA